LAVVFLLKLLVVLQLKDHPLLQPDAGLDTTAYVDLARRVIGGDIGLGPGLYYVSPLYIYFLALAYGGLRSDEAAVTAEPVAMSLSAREHATLETRAGIGGIVAGGLLLTGRRGRA
jgi:hypothetical protein